MYREFNVKTRKDGKGAYYIRQFIIENEKVTAISTIRYCA